MCALKQSQGTSSIPKLELKILKCTGSEHAFAVHRHLVRYDVACPSNPWLSLCEDTVHHLVRYEELTLSIMAFETSRAMMLPSGPSTCAAMRAAEPVPLATSKTLVAPGSRLAKATSRSHMGPLQLRSESYESALLSHVSIILAL